MGAPLLAISALARSRTGRRVAVAFFSTILLLVLVALAPLAVIPLALIGSPLPAAADVPVPGAPPAVNGDWGYPLSGNYTKGRGFGHNPVDGCSYCSVEHQGYDMAQGCDATIYAAGPGTVAVAGSYYGYGNAVLIDHGGGVETLYGHMQWESLRVAVGQQVTAGIPLGAEGNTGNSFGCHLHFEVRQDGVAIDAEPFMAGLGLPLK